MIKLHKEVEQRSDEWFALRCGIITASEVKKVVSKKTDRKTKEVSWVNNNDEKSRAHVSELASQRMTNYVEPSYLGHDMIRGMEDELEARILYDQYYAEVSDVGFVTNDKWDLKLGFSPDGFIGDDGLIEIKSRKQKLQFDTIISNEVPDEFMLQIQTGLLVSERKWLDFISYCGGMPMFVKRVYPDKEIQEAIIESAKSFEKRIKENIKLYKQNKIKLIPTERKIEGDII